MNCKIGNSTPKTLAQLIYQRTGQRLPAFAEVNGFPLTSLIAWNLHYLVDGVKIKASRDPGPETKIRLAKILKVNVEQIEKLTTRRKK